MSPTRKLTLSLIVGFLLWLALCVALQFLAAYGSSHPLIGN